jgi:HK97 family phage portal protein
VGLRDIAAVLGGEGRGEQRSVTPLFDLLTGAWTGGTPRRTASVSYEAAQAHGAVFACVDLLCRLVAWQMPAYVNGAPARATIVTNPHPLPQMSASHWRAQALQAAMLRGFAAGIVTEFEPSGWPRKILPLHPDKVTWVETTTGWEWYADGRAADLWQTGGNLWVAPSPRVTPGEPVGMSVLRYAAQKINLGLSATKFGADFFDASGLPVAHGRILDSPSVTQQQAEALKRRILETTRNREPMITGSNFELSMLPIRADESQFLETIQANDAQVCQFFGIPPESIGGSSGDSMTYANVEGRNLALLTNTVGAWMAWFESLFTDMLPRPQSVSLDPEALLRTSVPTLFATAEVGLSSGMLTRDEARAMIGYGPADDQGGATMSSRELAEALQKIYLAVGTVISVDEAREILNRDGAGLVLPAPAGAQSNTGGA